MRRRRAFVAGAIIGANVAARREYRRERGPCPCAQCGTVNVTRQTSVTYVQTGYAPPPPQNTTINYYQQPPRSQPGQYGAPPSTPAYDRPMVPGPDYQAPPPTYQNCPPPSAPSYGNGPPPGPPGPPGTGYQPYPNPPPYSNQPYPPQ